MRPRNGEFGVFPRKINEGKNIYYYWVYDSDGNRKFRSTGKATCDEAIKYCRNLQKKGLLCIDRKYQFSTYTEKFFIFDECPYIQNRLLRGKSYTRSWADQERRILTSRIQPHFGDSDIREITERQLDDWIMSLKAEQVGSKTINHIITILKIIFSFAVRERIIEENPCEHIEPFTLHSREKGILTTDELRLLLDPARTDLWKTKVHYALNLTATVTGMRLGELLALRFVMVQNNKITVANAWNPKDGLKCTKSGKVREIPIPESLSRLLLALRSESSGEYVFSTGETPMDHNTVYRYFYRALEGLGISRDERIRRNITFHSYRHGFNTRLLESGLSPETVRLLTGHSVGMTARYSHVQLTNITLPTFPLALPA